MFARVRLCLVGAAMAAALSASAAGAATVDLQFDRFARGKLAEAKAARAAFLAGHTVTNLHTEGFEGYRAWNGKRGKADPRRTAVGSFKAIGKRGSGHSMISDGRRAQVRGDKRMRWGRYDTDGGPLGSKWLDSNDNTGMRWKIGGIGAFNAVTFFVLDAADVGGKFSIKVGDTLYRGLAGTSGRLRNGNVHFVRILLDQTVEDLTVVLKHNRRNDGFGIDGIAVGNVQPVPLPPAAALMLGGLGGLARLRRRRAA